MKAFPLDMSQYHSLFNSTRLPVLQAQDELVGYESSDQSRYGHVLVLKNDNFYTVPAVQDDGEWEDEVIGVVYGCGMWVWHVVMVYRCGMWVWHVHVVVGIVLNIFTP